jgi:hypothetical protein
LQKPNEVLATRFFSAFRNASQRHFHNSNGLSARCHQDVKLPSAFVPLSPTVAANTKRAAEYSAALRCNFDLFDQPTSIYQNLSALQALAVRVLS